MKSSLSRALALAGLTCVLAAPVLAATGTTDPSGTNNGGIINGSALPPGSNPGAPNGSTNSGNNMGNGSSMPGTKAGSTQ